MKTIITLIKKELTDLFSSVIAYVFLLVFLLLNFWLFFTNVFVVGQTSLRDFFTWQPILYIILLPALTMSRWSDEKKLGTQELLFTLPMRTSHLVLAKFLACFVFLFLVLLLTLPLPLTLARLGDLDWGVVWASYLGSLLLGSVYLSLGVWISSLTKNQIVAFLFSSLLLYCLYIIGEPLVTAYSSPATTPVLQFVGLSNHYFPFLRGMTDTRDVFYLLSLCLFFLGLNMLSVLSGKTDWSFVKTK